MNSVCERWARAAVVARATMVALVLVCAAPGRMEARVPTSDGRAVSSADLSAEDWTAIQARLAQAGAHAPLVTSEVAKLTADAAASDFFGYSVAVSGDTVVVGAVYDDDVGDSSGSAYIFARNQGGVDNWGQVAKLTASDAAANDWFGCSVAISGDTIVVGAPYDDDACPSDPDCDSGSAYVYERNQGGVDNWGQVQKLTASDAAPDAYFGYAVSISADTVVVGAHGDNSVGAAYVFERNFDPSNPSTPLADNWGEVQKLTAGDAAYGDHFGNAVSVSGDTIVVGAEEKAGGPCDSLPAAGAAYIFERNQSGADSWGQVRELNAGDAAADDRFGCAVSVSGDTLVVGAYREDGGPGDPLSAAGAAYVFERNQGGADDWGQVKKLTASDAAAWHHFGYAVAISGDAVVIGTFYDDVGGERGAAHVYERNQGGADNWGEVQELTASDVADGDRFGHAVSISGNTAVVGAPYDDDGGNESGSAYVFARCGAAWAQQQKPVANDGAASDFFGTSVSVSGDAFIAGAPGNDDSGSAYLFYRNQDSADQWGQVRRRHNSLLPTGVEFGRSVAIDVDTALVGAPEVDKAYVFERNGGGADEWEHVKTLTDTTDADFGNSVSISGDTVVVGAPFDDVACSNCGAAYVYERNYDSNNPGTPLADNWGLRAVLTATVSPADGDQFGWSVAISGDTVVVGAQQDTHNGKSQAGSVYVFKRNYDWDNPTVPKADNWGLVRNLTASDAAAGDWFGHAVAISGDTFVVGAPYDDLAGSTYVFERNRDWQDGWGQVQELAGDDTASGDVFGWSVGICGDTMVVGAPYDDDGGDGSGSAYLFERNEGGADNWGQVEKLAAEDAAEDDQFGWSVGISGNTVVVGAPYDDDGGDGAGSTYVFRWGAAGVYLPLAVRRD